VIALEVADLVVIASRTLGLDTDQVLDLLDPAAAERALAQAGPGREPGDPGRQAAALLYALVRERPLRRGNQQVALVAMLQFLAMNGWDLDSGSARPVATVVTQVAAGAIDPRDVADWLAPRLRPSGRAAARVKEAPMRRALPLAEKVKLAIRRTQPRGRFVRFTNRARQAVGLAEQEARRLRHHAIGAEHLLLGLLEEGAAVHVLESLGISPEDVRGRTEEIIGRGQAAPAGHIPLTPQARQSLSQSRQEALQLGHHYIGTEHLLLGLLCEGEAVPAGSGRARRRPRPGQGTGAEPVPAATAGRSGCPPGRARRPHGGRGAARRGAAAEAGRARCGRRRRCRGAGRPGTGTACRPAAAGAAVASRRRRPGRHGGEPAGAP